MLSRLELSELLRRPVLGPSGTVVGRTSDVVVRLLDAGTPTVTGGLVRIGERDVFISIAAVAGMDADGIHLSAERVDMRPFERRRGEVLLDGDVRGRAVVDVERARLVRVADLLLDRQGADWHVVAVLAEAPASLSGLVRRVLRRDTPLEEVPWRQVEPLVGHVPTAARPLTLLSLAKLKPAEIADIVEAASHDEGEQILDAVSSDEEFEADVFEELDETHRLEFLKDRSDAEAAAVLTNMEPDHAADLLLQLPQERRLPILNGLKADQHAKVRALLHYGPETAGGLMNNEFVAFEPGQTAGSALEQLRRLPEVPTVLADVFVVEESRLVGSISLSDLVRSPADSRLRELIRTEPEAVYADADLPGIAVHMADYNLSSLPVIDEKGMLIGVVTFDDLIEAMLPDEWRWRGRPAVAHLAAGAVEAGPAEAPPAG